MVELLHAIPEPIELAQHRRQNPAGEWDSEDFQKVRPVVRRQLHREQQGLCVYCESLLGEDDGHIEHIKSKSLTGFTFQYDNLAHCCDSSEHCGHFKQRQLLPVEPRAGCNDWFALMALDGRIVPAFGLNEPAKVNAQVSLDILGLNDAKLAASRKEFARLVGYMSANDWQEFISASTIPFRWTLRRL